VERQLVAEKERLVGRHRLDHGIGERRQRHAFKRRDELGEAREPLLARDRHQPTLDQILLVGRKHEAGPLAQQLADIVVVLWRHDTHSPANSRFNAAGIWSSGSTAEARPALVTWPGIPHTTLEGSSCAITAPPAAASAWAPRNPSAPMPVRTRPSTQWSHTAAAVSNIGSTAGL